MPYPKSVHDARYTMWATVIPRLDSASLDTGGQPSGAGHFERTQDPDSFEISTTWVPDAPQTPGTDEAQYDIECYARGYQSGYRSSANTERYSGTDYHEIEDIQFDFPLSAELNRQSYVTNIRGHKDDTDYLWVDYATGQPVVWEIQGITPVFDQFGKKLRYTTVLKRAEIQ